MLFNSVAFIFCFLPLTFVGFFLIARFVSHTLAAAWLTAASFFFYGYWDPRYVPLLAGSILFNFALSRFMAGAEGPRRRLFLTIGIVGNLLVLGYFKYANFFLNTLNAAAGTHIELAQIVLPLGISFFTFTQIAFLVDTYRHIASEPRLVHYSLFVTYFPHLIAGPVLHHKEMMPQFARAETYRLRANDVAVGTTIFAIGLFKKVILADNVATFATPLFNAAALGGSPTMLEAWGGALAYAMQLYFDFSGYSDMAIGASRMFGVRLPLNFNSPYKAASIIDFWRRWHMTLSRFLRDYLYLPLGGNRKGPVRRYANLLTTMLLGGLWHGAGWTFFWWGGLHGLYLMINHGWRALIDRLGIKVRSTWFTRGCAVTVTFLAVLVGWVFFRAQHFDAALSILRGMAGLSGVVLPAGWAGHFSPGMIESLAKAGIVLGEPGVFMGVPQVLWIVALLGIAFFCPNTQEIMRRFEPALDFTPPTETRPAFFTWRPSFTWALFAAIVGIASVASLDRVTEFLYFQF